MYLIGFDIIFKKECHIIDEDSTYKYLKPELLNQQQTHIFILLLIQHHYWHFILTTGKFVASFVRHCKKIPFGHIIHCFAMFLAPKKLRFAWSKWYSLRTMDNTVCINDNLILLYSKLRYPYIQQSENIGIFIVL